MNHLTPRKKQNYGWMPDLPDHRDILFSAYLKAVPFKLPAVVDLRPLCPPVYDQGQLGSCTANAIAALFQFDEMKESTVKAVQPSRLFIYYNERVMEGSVSTDSGAQIRDGIKSVHKIGVCPETEWPYNISKFAVKPPVKCFADARKYESTTYMRVSHSLMEMKNCIAQGYPFAFGFTVYQSFESDAVAKTGIMPMPKPHEKVIGGHAVAAVGYDDNEQVFIIRNSWGESWGLSGYFKMPYAYITNPKLCSDFWTIRTITEN